MISRINGVFKVNHARKCVFPTLGAVPGDWNFRVLKYWLKLYFFVSDNDVAPICKRNYAKIYSTFSVNLNNVVQPPIIFTINSSYLSVYSSSPWYKAARLVKCGDDNIYIYIYIYKVICSINKSGFGVPIFTCSSYLYNMVDRTFCDHFFYAFFCPGTITTHAESINSDLHRGLDRRLRHIQH